MTSNGCKSWNSQIRQKRVLPITKFIDSVHALLVNQMNDRRENAASWSTKLCKNTHKRIRDLIENGRSWNARPASANIWEVFSNPTAVVDLGQSTCSCRGWQISGFPCVHAVVVIFQKLNGEYGYVDKFYHTKTYQEAY